ncbi:hypothetical protein DDI_3162 [Dickeya dianthicola RNS04.9]|nr:hypothetical protein DDI_3162 [Dickeya dianthicola RNS04.9]
MSPVLTCGHCDNGAPKRITKIGIRREKVKGITKKRNA